MSVMRVAVSLQERLQPQHVGRLRLADQRGPACARFDQPDPAQDQGTQNPLAEIRLGDDQRAQLLRRHQQRLGVFFGVPVHQRMAPGQLRDLGKKMPRTLARDGHDVPQAVALADRDDAFQHDEHAGARLAGREQAGAALVAAHVAETTDARDFRFRQHREHLVPTAGECAGVVVVCHGIGARGGIAATVDNRSRGRVPIPDYHPVPAPAAKRSAGASRSRQARGVARSMMAAQFTSRGSVPKLR